MPIITSDQIGVGAPGITFGVPGQMYFIVPDVIVAGDAAFDGIFTLQAASMLLSHGFVVAAGATAVHFEVGADNSAIHNYADGTFSGLVSGLSVESVNVTIDNDGEIEGIQGAGVALAFTSSNILLTNAGGISSAQTDGISSEGSSNSIVNTATGTVTGANNGILVYSSDSSVTNSGYVLGQSLLYGLGVAAFGDNVTVHNNTGGTIEGGQTGVGLFWLNQSLWNAGTIIGDAFNGVYALSSNAVIENVSGGLIQGDSAGIESQSTDAVIVNAGTVSASGQYGILLSFTAPAFASLALEFEPGPITRIENSGTVFGPQAGIGDYADQQVLIDNLGLIHSTGFGIDVTTNAGQLTLINNLGTIHGDTAAVQASTQVGLTNGKTGVIAGDVTLGAAADEVENLGTIYGDVNLGAGNDSYRGRGNGDVSGTVFGGDGIDRLVGGRGDDVLSGGTSSDFLNGGYGDDTIIGGANSDKLYGGAGADTFVFDDLDTRTSAPDTIFDFSHDQGDIIDFSLMDANTTPGNLGDQAFIFDGTTVTVAAGHMYYTVGGDGTWTFKGHTNGDASVDVTLIVRQPVGATFFETDLIL